MASNEGEGAPDAQEGLMFHQKMKLSFDPAAPPPAGQPDFTSGPNRPGLLSIELPEARHVHPLHGRAALVRSLVSSIVRRPPDAYGEVHVLHGLGGCGKSSVAQDVARRALRDGVSVWWVNAAGPARISACLREVTLRLGVATRSIDDAWAGRGSAPDLLWRALNGADTPWLLIFDNADEPNLLGASDSSVAEGTGWARLPVNQRGTVLITSRQGNRDIWGPWATLHKVSTLNPQDGARVLLDIAGPAAGSQKQAQALAARLGGLPLALRAAATYLAPLATEPPWRDSETIRTFDQYHEALDARSNYEFPETSSSDLDETLGLEIVEQTCELSIDLLDSQGLLEARALLSLFAIGDAAPFPYAGLLNPRILSRAPQLGPTNESRIRTLIQAVTDYALVDRHTLGDIDDPTFASVLSLHPVVRDVVRGMIERQGARSAWTTLLVELLSDVLFSLSPDDPRSWSRWRPIAPHCSEPLISELRAVQDGTTEPRNIGEILTILRLTGRYLIAIGLPTQAEPFLSSVLSALAPRLRATPEALAVRHEYARTLLEQGRSAEAEAELRPLLALREAILGPGALDTLATRHKLARAIMEQGQWAEAEPQLRLILEDERRLRGPEHNDTLVVQHTLGRAILEQGRQIEAEKELRDVLEVRDRAGGSEHPEAIMARRTLAQSLFIRGEYEQAVQELQSALRGGRHVWDRNHPELLIIYALLDEFQE